MDRAPACEAVDPSSILGGRSFLFMMKKIISEKAKKDLNNIHGFGFLTFIIYSINESFSNFVSVGEVHLKGKESALTVFRDN